MKKLNILFFLILFFNFYLDLSSQKKGQDRIDSLTAELAIVREDTNKVKLLDILAVALSAKDTDTS